MSNPKPIRVLYMEDDLGLARLVQKKCERAGFVVDIAGDGEKGLAMYDEGSYDLVLVDQSMPGREGLEVIGFLASRNPLPSMIMVTGHGSELIAVEAMKLGARDYIVKDMEGRYLELLPSVIERVLQQHRLLEEKQRAEEALAASEQRLDAIIKSVPDIIYRLDPNGCITFVSDAVTHYGYSTEDLIDTSILELVHPDDRQKAVYRINERRTVSRNAESLEVRLLVKQHVIAPSGAGLSGIARDPIFLITAKGLYLFDKPNPKSFVGTQGIARDITERKRAEEEREKLIHELQEALAKVKTLRGLLPICASCKKIRDDKGYWNQIETFIQQYSDAEFSHSVCPECVKKLYPELPPREG